MQLNGEASTLMRPLILQDGNSSPNTRSLSHDDNEHLPLSWRMNIKPYAYGIELVLCAKSLCMYISDQTIMSSLAYLDFHEMASYRSV